MCQLYELEDTSDIFVAGVCALEKHSQKIGVVISNI